MLKIRLMRIGTKKRPFYRVIVKEERSKRDGDYLELLGTYNPLTEPKDIKLKQDRIDYWIKQGAQMSVGFLRIIGKAPQRKPRKPKKEKKAEQPAAISLQPSDEKPTEKAPESEESKESKVEETKVEEKPAEEAVIKEEPKAAEEKPATPVIPSASEESLANASQNESGDSSAAPQNDKVEKTE